MKCTECRKEIKPVVAVDIDGTLGDYHRHFLYFASEYLGKTITPSYYGGSLSFKKWFCQELDVTEDIWHDIKLAYRQGGQKRSMPVIKGAEGFIAWLHELGVEVWITTTRPYIRHDNIDPDTREWMRRNNIESDYLLYDGHKYQKLLDLVGPDRVIAVLDDLDEELVEAEQMFGHDVPILRMNDFNSHSGWKPPKKRARDFGNAKVIIGNALDAWRVEWST